MNPLRIVTSMTWTKHVRIVNTLKGIFFCYLRSNTCIYMFYFWNIDFTLCFKDQLYLLCCNYHLFILFLLNQLVKITYAIPF